MNHALSMPSHRRAQQGYGLIVIAALFTAFAVIAATMLDRNSAMADLRQQAQARAQLARLNTALARFANDNGGRLPCPAASNVLASAATFGQPVSTSCYTGSAPSGTGFLTGTATANSLLRGTVPVAALIPYGISLDDAFDPWGSRIHMTVVRDMTVNAPSTTILNTNRPVVTDYITGLVVSPAPDVVLVSYGKDRMNGVSRTRTTAAITCSGTERRATNCDTTRNLVTGPLLTGAGIASTAYFDDFVSVLRLDPTSAGSGSPCAAVGTYNWVGGTVPASNNYVGNCSAALPAMNDGQSTTLKACVASSRVGYITVTCNNGTLDKASGSTGMCLKSSCFLGEVRVTLADGVTVPIDTLKVGDKVLGQREINEVLSVPTITDGRPIYGFNGGAKFVTAGHPFYTTDGWKAIDPTQTPIEGHEILVGKLERGDRIRTEDGLLMTITSIDREESGEHTLYNPTVSGDHTYYANGLLVHNKIGAVTCP